LIYGHPWSFETMTTQHDIVDLLLGGPPYLEDKKPFLTVTDIADALDVTKTTVRNNTDSVVTHPMIESDTVGQASVYYRSFEPSAEWGEAIDDTDVDEIVGSYLDDQQIKLVMQRGLWLHKRQTLLDKPQDEIDAEYRLEVWDSLIEYFRQMTLAGRVSFSAALRAADLPKRYDEIDLSEHISEGDPLPDAFAHLESLLYDIPLFDGPDGEPIEGLVTLYPHHLWLTENITEETGQEKIDELAPEPSDIIYSAELLDRLAVQLYGFDW